MPVVNLQGRSQEFGKSILVFTADLPRSIIYQEITRQLVRSGTSIGANLFEGKGGSSRRDFLNYLLIARKSAYETAYWLELTRTFNTSLNTLELLITECTALTKILTTIILNAQQNQQKKFRNS